MPLITRCMTRIEVVHQGVAEAIEECHRSGKVTNFSETMLEQCNTSPNMEQALDPDSYAAHLQEKINLDFNYLTQVPHGLPSKPPGLMAGSSADAIGRTVTPEPAPWPVVAGTITRTATRTSRHCLTHQSGKLRQRTRSCPRVPPTRNRMPARQPTVIPCRSISTNPAKATDSPTILSTPSSAHVRSAGSRR